MKPQTIKAYAAIGKSEGREYLLISPRTMVPAIYRTRPMMTGYAADTGCKIVPVEIVIRKRRKSR